MQDILQRFIRTLQIYCFNIKNKMPYQIIKRVFFFYKWLFGENFLFTDEKIYNALNRN
jgi:hypothetical protein